MIFSLLNKLRINKLPRPDSCLFHLKTAGDKTGSWGICQSYISPAFLFVGRCAPRQGLYVGQTLPYCANRGATLTTYRFLHQYHAYFTDFALFWKELLALSQGYLTYPATLVCSGHANWRLHDFWDFRNVSITRTSHKIIKDVILYFDI